MPLKLLYVALLVGAYLLGAWVGLDNGFRAGVLECEAFHAPEDNP